MQTPQEPPTNEQRRIDTPAWLPSEGRPDGRATLHTFERRQRESTGIVVYYKCTETGAERQWGLEQ